MPHSDTETRKVWQVLIARATNRQTITYGELAAAIGNRRMARAIGHAHLDPISDYCAQRSMPPLWVIVVNQGTGRSSGEGPPGMDIDAEREKVFAYPWFAQVPYPGDE